MKTYLTIMFRMLLTIALLGGTAVLFAILAHSTEQLKANPGLALVIAATMVATLGAWFCFRLLYPSRPDIVRPAPQMTIRRRRTS